MLIFQPTFKATANPIVGLIFVVINAILEVFFLCLVGWILARKGIVDASAKKTLNKINVTLFTPALLFSKVAFSLTPDKLADLAIIPIGFIIITSFSALVAYLLGHALRLKRPQRNFAIACAMFQNSNSMPIALMQSLIAEKMPLEWGEGDTKDQMLGRALSYLVLYSTLGIIVRWSVGVKLLVSAESMPPVEEPPLSSLSSNGRPTTPAQLESSDSTLGQEEEYEEDEEEDVTKASDGDQTGLLLGGRGRDSQQGSLRRKGNGVKTLEVLTNGHGEEGEEGEEREDHRPKLNPVFSHNKNLKSNKRRTRSPIFQSFPNTPMASQRGSVYSSEGDRDDEEEDEDEEDPEWGLRRGFGRRDHDEDDIIFHGIWSVRWKRFKRRTGIILRPVIKLAQRIGQFMTVPLWAALLSLFVACVPPLQHALIEAEPLRAAIRNAGNCSVPLTLITLGAYFYRPTPAPSSPTHSEPPTTLASRLNPFSRSTSSLRSRIRTGEGETRTVFVAVFSRMVLTPLVMLPLFGWYARMTTNVADDPVFVVTACLLIGSPTAITLAQITSNASGDLFEKLISRTLFVAYAFMTAPTTILLVLSALLIDRYQ